MARFIILAVVLAIAFTLYSLVDAAMTDPQRARGVPKPMWVVICVLLPVVGGILWLSVGKGDGRKAAVRREVHPDDDPRYGAMSTEHVDQRIADLESQLRALDDEVYPGEGSAEAASPQTPAADDGDETDSTADSSKAETDTDETPGS